MLELKALFLYIKEWKTYFRKHTKNLASYENLNNAIRFYIQQEEKTLIFI